MCFFCFMGLAAYAEVETLPIPPEITPSQREIAMPELGSTRIEKLLTRYYEEGLGGIEVWKKINSMRTSGTLEMEDTTYDLISFQLKPDRIKLVLKRDSDEVVLGYDGNEVWQHYPKVDHPGSVMPDEDARQFIHSSVFGNYLLYPYRGQKKIEYIDTVPEAGTVCHQIRVTLDSNYQVDYYIDVRTHLEIRIDNYDRNSNKRITLRCSDYQKVDGLPVAHLVKTFNEADETITIFKIDTVKFNVGLVNWFFKRP